MNIAGLSKDTFSLRDYIAILFPGILVIISVIIIYPTLLDKLNENGILATIIILVIGYLFGFASNIIGEKLILPPIDKKVGDPFLGAIYPDKSLQYRIFDQEFRNILITNLEKKWGPKILKGNQRNLLFLCRREIQKYNHSGLAYLLRLVTLYNTARAYIFPCILIMLSLIIIRQYTISVFVLFIILSLYLGHYHYRLEFVREVFRIWYILNKDSDL